VLLDFSKALDSVDHQLVCSKLSCQYKFSSSAINLIRSYLCGRMQWVWIGSQASEILPVASGVVQGSVLDRLLFSLFINANPFYHVDITCMQTTYNFTSAAILQIMLIVSVDSTSTLTIYYSGNSETASQSTRAKLRPWWLILDFYN
jgi:hypothetical protein